ncbi:hypothetical protein CIW53_05325 [Rhodanobacter sp. T12-5]|nr:hypothetical protein CIW53_05325 [Rhodanobacter sp. T12-5]
MGAGETAGLTRTAAARLHSRRSPLAGDAVEAGNRASQEHRPPAGSYGDARGFGATRRVTLRPRPSASGSSGWCG